MFRQLDSICKTEDSSYRDYYALNSPLAYCKLVTDQIGFHRNNDATLARLPARQRVCIEQSFVGELAMALSEPSL
jgi:hypothetical protein